MTVTFKKNPGSNSYEAAFYDHVKRQRVDVIIGNYELSIFEQERMFNETPCEYGDCPDSTLTEDTCGCDCTNCPFGESSDYQWQVVNSTMLTGMVANNWNEMKNIVVKTLEGRLDSLPKDSEHQPVFNVNITQKLKSLEWEFTDG